MSEELKIGRFDRVRIETDGPDVRLTLPKNPAQAHWADFAQVCQGLALAIKQAQAWEAENLPGRGRLQ